MKKEFVLGDLLNSQYQYSSQSHSTHIVHSTQTTIRQHSKILIIINIILIMQTVMKKISFTDIQM